MREASDPLVASALDRLAREDEELALLADAALEHLTEGEGLQVLSLHAVQEFLWSELPVDWPSDHLRVAEALGRLLALLDLPRYAEACRSPTTAQVLEAYAAGQRRGEAACQRALEASGVEPPDLPELTWSEVMGAAEHAAYDALAAALEIAAAAGEVHPGTRGWRKRQRAVARYYLAMDRAELGGRSHLEEIAAERVTAWVERGGQRRRRLLLPLLDRLLEPLPVPSDLDALEPLRWLLQRAEEGVALTPKGNLPRDLVRDAVDRFGWWHLPQPPRVEADVRPLYLLHGFAHDIGALRPTRRRLALGRTGKRLLADPERLWRTVARGLWPGPRFPGEVAEIAVTLLLWDERYYESELAAEVAPILSELGWRDVDTERPPSVSDVRAGIWRFAGLAEPLGLVRILGDDRDPVLHLTPFGIDTGLEALRARAAGPRAL